MTISDCPPFGRDADHTITALLHTYSKLDTLDDCLDNLVPMIAEQYGADAAAPMTELAAKVQLKRQSIVTETKQMSHLVVAAEQRWTAIVQRRRLEDGPWRCPITTDTHLMARLVEQFRAAETSARDGDNSHVATFEAQVRDLLLPDHPDADTWTLTLLGFDDRTELWWADLSTPADTTGDEPVPTSQPTNHDNQLPASSPDHSTADPAPANRTQPADPPSALIALQPTLAPATDAAGVRPDPDTGRSSQGAASS